jgi:hypothetical protein
VQKKSFHEEREQVFGQYPEWHMKMLIGDFNAKLERKKDIFKPTNRNKHLQKPSNGKVVKVMTLAATKYIIIKSIMFPYCNIHKHT